MWAIAGAILVLAGSVLMTGANIAHDISQAHTRTGYHRYGDTWTTGLAIAILGGGLIMLELVVWVRSLRKVA